MKRKKTLLKRGLAFTLSLAMLLTGQISGMFVNTAKAADPTDNLFLYYDFNLQNSFSTVITDASGNGNAGQLKSNGSGSVEGTYSIEDANIYGKAVKALKLTGGDDGPYLQMPNGILNGKNAVTISMWVKLTTNTSYQRIWDFGNDTTSYMYLLSDGGNTGFKGYSAAITESGWSNEKGVSKGTNFSKNRWVLTTVVMDGTNMSLYENGVQVGETVDTGIAVSDLGATTANYIGKGQFPDPPTEGWFAEVKFYDRALSATEISDMYEVDDAGIVAADKADLSIANADAVTENFSLSTSGANGSAISWTSTNPAINVNGSNAAVTRPAFADGNATGKLTATITYGTASDTKEFDVTVLAEFSDDQIAEHDADEALAALGDLSSVTADILLPTSNLGSSFTWESTNPAVTIEGNNAVVVRPSQDDGNATGKLKLTATYGAATAAREIDITVLCLREAVTITDVSNVSVTTLVGHSPSLPNFAKVTYSNGKTGKAKAVWPATIESNKYSSVGSFTVQGSLIGWTNTITANVTVVSEDEVAKAVVSESFDLSDISLDKIGDNGSILTQNRDRDIAYLKLLNNKRMLYNFYNTFGQTDKIQGVSALGGWDEPSGLLRGHSTGHYISALSLAYASTGDAEIKAKVDEMVSEMHTLQQMSHGNAADFQTAGVKVSGWSTDPNEWGEGFISAYSPDQFALLEQYTPYGSPNSGIWAPYYTLHKLLAGFLDAYRYTGNAEALEVAKGIGGWVYDRLSVLPQSQLTRMWDMYIAGEFGGMNESLASLYIYTGDAKYLDAAKLFDNTNFFNKLAVNVDDIKTRHANQHIPQIIGALREYEATVQKGSPEVKYYDIAKNFWEMVVSRYAYSIGGVGTGEKFTQPYQQAANIRGTENCETCAAYNMLKLTKMLNNYDPDNAEYMDYYERTLYNQIVASQSPNTSSSMHNGTTYMLPIGPGATRSYGGDYNSFTCCHGTGMENHVKYQEAAYEKTADTLYVSLYMPSTVTWEEKGVKVIQETVFPSDSTKLTVSSLGGSSQTFKMKLRIPYWATNGFNVKVNGADVAIDYEISTYATLTGIKAGDVIDIEMPWTLHLDKTPDKLNGAEVASVMYGPLVMPARESSTEWKTLMLSDNLPDSITISSNSSNGFPRLTSNGYEFNPMFAPEYARNAYDTYFKVITVADDDGKPWYEITINNTTPKFGSFTVNSELIKEGEQLIITANPNPEYMVKNLIVNGNAVQVDSNNTYTMTVTGEVAIEGSFRLINPPVPDPAHLEYTAQVTSDYTASWENIDRVNMEGWEPTTSAPGTGRGWGNWSQNPGSEHYIQYEWDTEVTMNKFDIYWYDDNGDTRVPSNIKIMYLDSSGQWQQANMHQAVDDVIATNQYNTITFDPVTTTAVKLVLTVRNGVHAHGILRWKVSYDDPNATPTPEPTPEPVVKTYEQVNAVSEIQDEDKIVMIYNGTFENSGEGYVLPKSVEKANSSGSIRVGFDVDRSETITTSATLTGDFTDKEWTFKQSGSGWLLSDGTGYAKLTTVSGRGITATFETEGDVFTISGTAGDFQFITGSNALNYNNRGVINGYASEQNPAGFYLYRLVEAVPTPTPEPTPTPTPVPTIVPPADGNVAVYAKADAKYTNTYGISTDSLNDGELATSDAHTSWNCWGTSDYPMWTTLTWDEKYDLTGIDVMWWSDNGGVMWPKSCYVEYLEPDGETWTKIDDVGVEVTSGGYNGANEVWNTVTFAQSITTTALRLMMERNGSGNTGLGISEWKAYGKVHIDVTPEPLNVAPIAQAEAKYTNTYGISTDKINDDILAGSAANTGWNSWGTSDYPMWVSLTWDTPYTLTGTEVMWWSDNGGVAWPASCYVEYLGADGETWTKIDDVGVEVTAGGYNGANEVWNTVTFAEPVVTTKLRLQIERNGSGNTGVGISEWRAYGYENKEDFYGAKIEGPTTLAVDATETFTGITVPDTLAARAAYAWSVADDSTELIEIDGAADAQTVSVKALKAGDATLKLTATFGGESKEASIQIKIEGVESIDDYITTTAAGKMPILPDSVVANGITFDTPTDTRTTRYNSKQLGETFDSSLIPVVWDEVPAALYAENQIGSTFTVNGTASYGGATYPAKAIITVNAPALVAESNRTVTFENVQLDDSFWSPKQETNALSSLNKAILEIEKSSGGEPNFDNAIKRLNGQSYNAFSGYVFQDSDIYKSIEAISYTLSATQNDNSEVMAAQRQKLQSKLNSWIGKIEAVQYADGYIDTHFTLRSTSYSGGGAAGTHRWNNFSNHEMYNCGHFLEAVVAYTRYREGIGDPDYRLYVAGRRFANEIVALFGPDGTRHEVPGHEEIELGMVKFAKLAEEYEGAGAAQKYYDTVKTLIDRRGERSRNRDSGYSGGTYSQDATAFKNETNAVGHAVRAGYFYTGVTDIAATLPDDNEDRAAYINSLTTIWDSVTNRRSYITGGVGTTAPGADSEGFGADYLLPPDQSYCEICAAIAMTNWNQRMNLLLEDGKYADVVEKDLYNAILVGTNLDGNRFYYSTLLETESGNPRSEWFSCACCPPNLMRTLASLSGYMYTVHGDNVFVNMYSGSTGKFDVNGTPVEVKQETNYPWEGAVKFTVNPETVKNFTFKLRIPGWVDEQENKEYTVKVNGTAVNTAKVNGYASVSRTWNPGDVIELEIPMEIRRTAADPNVEAQQGRIALQRGPIVYCVEKAGNAQLNPEIEDFNPLNFVIPEDAELTATYKADLLKGVVEITGDVGYMDGKTMIPAKMQAVPYYSWNNRGDTNEYTPGIIKNNSTMMQIWTWDSKPDIIEPFVDPSDVSLTSSSVKSDYTSSWENLEGIRTNWEPSDSYGDGKHTWGNWSQSVGSEHYVQYLWDEDINTYKMSIYWYDDQGGTRVPATLTIKYLKDGGDPNNDADWLDANMLTDWSTVQSRNKYNTIMIDKIRTKGIKLVMTVRNGGNATGICRWKVFDDRAGVLNTQTRIDAIGVVDGSEDCADLIKKARDAYDSLSAFQKAGVQNYDTLTMAEAVYEAIINGGPTPTPVPTAEPTQGPTSAPTDAPQTPGGKLDLSAFTTENNAASLVDGKIVIEDPRGDEESTVVYIPLSEAVNPGETVSVNIKGTTTGESSGFRAWVGDGPHSGTVTIKRLENMAAGSFDETFDLTAMTQEALDALTENVLTGPINMITLKSLAWNGPALKGITIESIEVYYPERVPAVPTETPTTAPDQPTQTPTTAPTTAPTNPPVIDGIDLSGASPLYGTGTVTYNEADGSVTGTEVNGLLIPLGMTITNGASCDVTVYGTASAGMRSWLSDGSNQRMSEIVNPINFQTKFTLKAEPMEEGTVADHLQIKGTSYDTIFSTITITRIVVDYDPSKDPTPTPVPTATPTRRPTATPKVTEEPTAKPDETPKPGDGTPAPGSATATPDPGKQGAVDFKQIAGLIATAESKNEKNYTPASYAKLKSALENARIASGSTATQAQADEASKKLDEAIKGLVELKLVAEKKLTIGLKEKVKVVYAEGYEYTTTDAAVATAAAGTVQGIKKGTAIVDAIEGNGNVTRYTIVVKKAPKKITAKPKKITLKAKKKAKIKIRLSKNSASYKITYKSSNKKVAKVSKKGKITALKKGTATITVKTFNKKKAKVKVTVR